MHFTTLSSSSDAEVMMTGMIPQFWILKQGLQNLKAIQLRHFDVEQEPDHMAWP